MTCTVPRRLLAALLAAVLVLPLASCGVKGSSGVEGRKVLKVGVKYDQPGIGLRVPDGSFQGFDVDVASYVARRLGADRVEFVGLTSNDREEFLAERKVDLVVASYSITPQRKTVVGFAGPYYVAHQDIMVREEEKGIRGPRDLRDRRLCKSEGSNSWKRVVEELGVRARLVDAGTYGECVQLLLDGELDAVTTDDLILAGFAMRQPDAFRMVNARFTDEKYGIGLHKDDIGGCEAVNRALTRMYQDGTAERLLTRWFAPTGLKTAATVPQFEGCD
ncbi:glutamate ABC transporter substrate-binding protein [Actinocorallia aurantiaca]|uniref:Glutamate ABC transporter substrate-binding protein n=1 Tax=Actinocorallia aurantiaca TaxID=46204 RepID=A0ABP6GPX2_9ACTN